MTFFRFVASIGRYRYDLPAVATLAQAYSARYLELERALQHYDASGVAKGLAEERSAHVSLSRRK
jgi:hypothetical protein